MEVFAVTNDIKVSVHTEFSDHHSKSLLNQFVYHYHVSIENLGMYPVKLLRRKWIITDATGIQRIVEGQGVLGLQPNLNPNEIHQYSSSCILPTAFGQMRGHYIFERPLLAEEFFVGIPEFKLEVPFLLS